MFLGERPHLLPINVPAENTMVRGGFLKDDASPIGFGHRLSIVIKIKLGVPVAPLKVGIYFRMCNMYHIIKSSDPHVKTRAKTTSEFVATITDFGVAARQKCF